MKGRLFALFLLGMSFVRTLLTWFFRRQDPLLAFEEHYGAEGILAVSKIEHELLTLRYHCTACGECDRGEGERIKTSRVGYRGLRAFVLGGTRSLEDASAVQASLVEVPDEAIARGTNACPEGVPIESLVRLVRLHGARQGTLATNAFRDASDAP